MVRPSGLARSVVEAALRLLRLWSERLLQERLVDGVAIARAQTAHVLLEEIDANLLCDVGFERLRLLWGGRRGRSDLGNSKQNAGFAIGRGYRRGAALGERESLLNRRTRQACGRFRPLECFCAGHASAELLGERGHGFASLDAL